MPLPTEFLPAERVTDAEVRRQRELIQASSVLPELLNAMMGFALILNHERQVVFANKAFQDFLNMNDIQPLLGRRPGEIAHCVNAERSAGGCGTTEGCRLCGTARAIAAALDWESATEECRLQSRASGEDLDLLVRGTPFKVGGEDFVIFAAVDISGEKRRRALERIFFHDVINTAGGIQGLAGIMTEVEPDVAMKEFVPKMQKASDRLLDEINSQRDLAAAETGELKIKAAPVNSKGLLSDLVALYEAHQVGKGRKVVLAPDCEDVSMTTDRILLLRVLGNLMKNALEASPAGSEVRVCSRCAGGQGVFTVQNPSVMPREVQLQVFQRSFSTKGENRGLGTYSIRLLTERYLKGKVSFVSSPETGTVFTAVYPLTLE